MRDSMNGEIDCIIEIFAACADISGKGVLLSRVTRFGILRQYLRLRRILSIVADSQFIQTMREN
ncbi:MAG TPA: hypothetical protein V6D14_33285 [Coleofasciculaceae cyanobacterium]